MRKRKIFLFMFFILLVSIDGVNAAEYVKCGDVDGIPAGLPEFSRNVINVIKFGVPIILCILGMLDFAKAVMAGDEKAMSDGPKKFIKRVISAVLIYFVVAIVQFIFNLLGDSDTDQTYMNKDNLNSCLKCFISDESGCSEDNSTENNS